MVTPPRREVNGHGGLWAPGSRLPLRGTRVAPHIFTEARDRDVSSDRRNVPWSPKNILIDTVARLQQDLADIRAGRNFRTGGILFVRSCLPKCLSGMTEMSWIWTLRWTFVRSYSRAVVATVGLDTVRMGEETPMDCDGECAEWDIRNEFETINGMPVYYGGDLYDSDDSDWEDPRDLAYAEHVDRKTLMLWKECNCWFLNN